jgi:hypothetical protein
MLYYSGLGVIASKPGLAVGLRPQTVMVVNVWGGLSHTLVVRFMVFHDCNNYFIKRKWGLSMMVHAYNPSYLEGTGQRIAF